MDMLHIGFYNYVNPARVIAIMKTTSSPLKRVKREARENGMLIDGTEGRRTHSVIITDTGHVICSRLTTNVLNARMEELRGN